VRQKALAFLVTLMCTAGSAQMETIVLSNPIRARNLSGVVVDSTGAIVSQATVSLIDCPIGRGYPAPENKTLFATKSDAKGEFSLDPQSFKKPYCMRVSSPGFDPVEFEVKLSHFAGRLRIKMHVAS
jgi:hypothetical protein